LSGGIGKATGGAGVGSLMPWLLLLLLFLSPLSHAEIGQRSLQAPMSILDDWAFMPDDKSEYSSVNFDDTAWPRRSLSDPRTVAGEERPLGIVWYRKVIQFEAPIDYARISRLGLQLEAVNYAVDVYAGGLKLGSIGGVDKGYPDFRKGEVWRIPAEAVTTDGRLVLALRVWGGSLSLADSGAHFRSEAQMLGDYVTLKQSLRNSKLPSLFMGSVLLLFSLFAFYLYRCSDSLADYFWFGCVCLATAVFTLVHNDWHSLFGLSAGISERLLFLSMVGVLTGGITLVWSLMNEVLPRWLVFYLSGLGAVSLALALQPSLIVLIWLRDFVWLTVSLVVPALFYLLYTKVRQKLPEARLVTLAVGVFLISIWHDMYYVSFSRELGAVTYYPFGFSTVLIIMVSLIGARFGSQMQVLEQAVQSRIAELSETNEQLKTLSERDSLTRLDTRRGIQQKAVSLLSRLTDVSRPPAVAILDIDGFKVLNDRYGHRIGDQVLTEFADRLRSSARSHDLIGRWGGEEFIVIVSGAERTEVIARLEAFRKLVQDRPFYCVDDNANDLYCDVTVTIGLTYHRSGEALEHALTRADRALYRGKDQGRNQIVTIDTVVNTGEPHA